MIDIQSETLLTFAEAAKRLPGRPNLSTLHRWRLAGVRGVKLETCLIGGKRYCSVESLDRFVRRLTEGQRSSTAPTGRATKKVRNNAIRRLDNAGIVER